MTQPGPEDYRSGFVAVVGRPNVGKSTLVNAIVGTKVSITSPQPNTTRRSVRAIVHRPGLQAVFVDTPGLHRPRTALGRRLNEHVGDALDDVDVVVPVVDAAERVGPGDRLVLTRAAAAAGRSGEEGRRASLLVVVNKIDRAQPAQLLERLTEAQDTVLAALEGCEDLEIEYFPVSALTGEGTDALLAAVLAGLPVGPPYFPDDMVSDSPEAFWVAELVREQLLAHVREELPHSIACRVTEWQWPRVRVEILVERDSQKGIVIGQGGKMLKDVGTAVRLQLPEGAFLELHVGVEKRWQQRSDAIERLGY